MESIEIDNEVGQRAPSVTAYEYPDRGLKAWSVVFGSFMTLVCTYGVMGTVGVLQSYWETHQLKEYSSSSIGWISSLFTFFNLFLGVQVGPLFDRYGPRWIMLGGSMIYTLSIFLLGSCKVYYQFMLCLGVMGGISSACLSTPSMASLSHWFHDRRGTATGVAMVGASVGGIMFPLILKTTLSRLGWGWAVRIIGFIFIVFLGIGNLCVRSRFPSKKRSGTIDLQCFTDSRFIWITAGAFLTEIVLFAALGLIPTYAVVQGFDTGVGFYLLIVFNASGSAFGRWLSGMCSDHLGRFNTLGTVISTTAAIIWIMWYPFGHYLGVLYPFCAILGFGTGTILSLTPVCLGQICDTDKFGVWFGTCYSVASFGTLVGIPIGGQLLQVAGPSRLVAVLGSILALAACCFVMARWACLGYRWRWRVKV
ncbi:hypothetical protein N7540_012227 [Penicillium herquei]|nr:hypothetical protein N7540_012227 [Penicillium herquei]